jgi:hypothetical protein
MEEGQFLIGGSCIIAPSGEMAALAQSLEGSGANGVPQSDMLAC